MKKTNKIKIAVLVVALAIVGAVMIFHSSKIAIEGQLNETPQIYPDYTEVTIPANIAPLNFAMPDSADYRLLISDGHKELWLRSHEGYFDIPSSWWNKLLESNKGKKITFTVCTKRDGRWLSMKPFYMNVAVEPADAYIAYRLIPPGYSGWKRMGLYQRCIENFTQTPIMENRLSDGNCMNCHSFCMQSPDKMLFHVRAKHGGTIVQLGDKVEKLDTKTPDNISALVYPSWHPGGRYVAFSTNTTHQSFFAHSRNRIEVFDEASDVVVYDTQSHKLISTPLLKDSARYETFPTFSPDGRSLYFCSAAAVDSMPRDYAKAHYNLCRIDFNPDNGTFGSQIEIVYDAIQQGGSCSFPRVSPDGRWLVFTHHAFGNFSIWHPEADLWMINLKTKAMKPMTAANSNNVDSYHSWSHNSRWMVFSSRRDDGLYTRPYFTYIDHQGHAHKPFMLPQRNPRKFYADQIFSYNIPEFVMGKVMTSERKFADVIRSDKATKILSDGAGSSAGKADEHVAGAH